MIPSLGRIVHVEFYNENFNGSATHPAVVTRVWSDDCINCRVLVDGKENPFWLTSVERKDIVEARPPVYSDGALQRPRAVWFWPPQPRI